MLQPPESFKLDSKDCDQTADGWSLLDRGSGGKIIADPNKFPSGIKHVSDYIHDKGSHEHAYPCFNGHEAHNVLCCSAFTYDAWLEISLGSHTAHPVDNYNLFLFVHCIFIKHLTFSALANVFVVMRKCLMLQMFVAMAQLTVRSAMHEDPLQNLSRFSHPEHNDRTSLLALEW